MIILSIFNKESRKMKEKIKKILLTVERLKKLNGFEKTICEMKKDFVELVEKSDLSYMNRTMIMRAFHNEDKDLIKMIERV